MLYDEFYKEGKSILDYWIKYGFRKISPLFYFNVSNENKQMKKNISAFLINARALWAFSLGYEIYGDEKYLKAAERAYKGYKYFADKKNGGYFCYKKGSKRFVRRIYDHSFAIYGLCRYYIVSKDESALQEAFNIFNFIEKISYDCEEEGYIDIFDNKWNITPNPKYPENYMKDMNTMLHVHEAYTLLYNVTKDEKVEKALRKLTRLFLDKIYNSETGHLNMFFDKHMASLSDRITCGHDIETSWLLWETYEILGDEAIRDEIKNTCIRLCDCALKDGYDAQYGGLTEHYIKGGDDNSKVWWVQSEAVVGAYNAYQLTGEEKYRDYAEKFWETIKKHFIASDGEWYHQLTEDMQEFLKFNKIGAMKCPYHNFRMCAEMMRRLK